LAARSGGAQAGSSRERQRTGRSLEEFTAINHHTDRPFGEMPFVRSFKINLATIALLG
jgi:hypothetical protein